MRQNLPKRDIALAIRPLLVRPRSGRKCADLVLFTSKKVSRIDDGSPKDRVFGIPPQRSPRSVADERPEIDLKSLWRSLRSFPQQAGGPKSTSPEIPSARSRAAKPESVSVFRSPGVGLFAPSQRGLSPRGICNPRSRHRPTPGILGFSTQPRKSPIFGDPPFFDFLTGVRTSECRHRRLWLVVRKGARCALAIAIRSLILSPPA